MEMNFPRSRTQRTRRHGKRCSSCDIRSKSSTPSRSSVSDLAEIDVATSAGEIDQGRFQFPYCILLHFCPSLLSYTP